MLRFVNDGGIGTNNSPEKKNDKALVQKKIGVIHSGSANTPGVDEAIDTFFVGLQALGWDESNLQILPTAFADGSPQTLNQIAAQMITDDVTVLIAAGGTAAALAGQAATATQITKTPVVFTSVRDWTTTAANSNLTGIIADFDARSRAARSAMRHGTPSHPFRHTCEFRPSGFGQ